MMGLDRIFQISAVILAAAAVYLFWAGNSDWAFFTGVLACSAFLLSIRTQARERMRIRESEKQAADNDIV